MVSIRYGFDDSFDGVQRIERCGWMPLMLVGDGIFFVHNGI